jgi:methionyl-tRNA formyltransferase
VAELRRVVFMGTPEFAVHSLRTLLEPLACSLGVRVVGVFTQPDRPSGRGRSLAPPVKVAAVAAHVPVFQPERLRRPEAFESLAALRPDLVIVAAYAQILSRAVLALPPLGCLNVHASLLPRYRGASPIQAAILDGAVQTGVTIMRMDEGLDTGPILAQATVAIDLDDTAASLGRKLAASGAELLLATLPDWIAGSAVALPQDPALATVTGRLSKADGGINWTHPALAIERHVRAMHPWPGAFTGTAHGPLKVLRAKVHAGSAVTAPPGTLLSEEGLPAVATGDGLLILLEVQPAGRRAMSGSAWLHGAAHLEGTVLGAEPEQP